MKSVCALFVLVGSCAFAQFQPPKDVAGSIGLIFNLEARDMISAAEAMPEDKYDFRPTEGAFSNVRTFAEQIKHVACANFGFAAEIRKQTPPEKCDQGGGPDPSRTKADILKYLRDSYDQVKQVINETTPQNMLDGPCQGRYGCPNTRLGVLQVTVWHSGDHYGQVVEYLRMNGIVPPGSQPQQNSGAAQSSADGTQKVRVSEKVLQGLLIRSVPPVYPPEARAARISGAVVLACTITTEGAIGDVRVVSGHPMLRRAAVDAVKQ
jgi:hypothetical protein